MHVLSEILAGFCLLLGGFALVLAAVTAGVMVRLLRSGPKAALEAYQKGASFKRWWSGLARPGQRSGTGLGGRIDPEVGVVMVETDISRPSWS